MGQRVFKVGDWVTPDEEALKAYPISTEHEIYKGIGKPYRVISTDYNSINLDRGVGESSPRGWHPDFWKLHKQQIVKQLINDL